MLQSSWRQWIRKLSRPVVRRTSRRPRLEQLEPRALLSGSGSISGTVYADLDHSGDQGQNEPGLSDVEVFLDQNHNGRFDDGREVYSDVIPQLPIALPDEVTVTSQLSIIRPAVIGGEGGDIIDLDVSINLTHSFIGDLQITLIHGTNLRVPLSLNRGGSLDGLAVTFDDEADVSITDSINAEFKVEGPFRPEQSLSAFDGLSVDGPWTLEVADVAGGDSGELLSWSLSALTTKTVGAEPVRLTDDAGSYHFAELPSGEYSVGVVLPPGTEVTQPQIGSFQQTTISIATPAATADFGLHERPGAIEGFVFLDGNGDGFQEVTEYGQDGVTVQLLDAATDEVLATTVTFTRSFEDINGVVEQSGYYRFDDVTAGTYLVRELVPEGFEQTAPASNQTPLVGPNPVVEAGSFEVTEPPRGTAENPAQWLPDLIIDPVRGLVDAFRDGDFIRFTQATPNVGHGPLRIVGGEDNGDGTQDVLQRIYDDQGGSTERLAGLFEFHPEHNHIHFNEFSEYRLMASLPDANDDGIPEVGELLRGGEKTSFCLIDISSYATTPPLPNAADQSSGLGCDTEQQISVGWEDIYGAGTPGQEINIAGLPNGQYWLEAVVDPANHFIEVDETNNFARVLITLRDNDRSQLVTVHSDEVSHVANFGNFRRFSISGTVFDDPNVNTTQDDGEASLAGRGVFLDLNGDGVLNNPSSGDGHFDGLAEEPWRLTDENGHYSFEDLGPNFNYSVAVGLDDFEFATSGSPISVIPNGSDFSENFGIADSRTSPTLFVSRDDEGQLLVRDITSSGVQNSILFEVDDAGALRITDRLALVTTTIGDVADEHTIVIPAADLPDVFTINCVLGGGDDFIEFSSLPSNVVATVVSGGNGSDTIQGSGRDDVLTGNAGNDLIQGGAGNDAIDGGGDNDYLSGNDGDDALLGDFGDDTLLAGNGNDTLVGGTGHNFLSGGEGTDSVSEVGIAQLTLTDTELTFGFELIIDPIEIDPPSIGVTTISLTQLIGADGIESLDSELQSLIKNFGTIPGLEDVLRHFRGSVPTLSEVLEEPEFQTVLQSLIGAGLSLDNLFTPEGQAVVTTIPPIDFSFGRSSLDSIETADLALVSLPFFKGGIIDASRFSYPTTLRGTFGNDTLMGGRAADDIAGDFGNDLIQGGVGNDVLLGGFGNDSIDGGGGIDTLDGADGDDSLTGGNGDDYLFGGRDNDFLSGGKGRDVLYGGIGDDTQVGGLGDDVFYVETDIPTQSFFGRDQIDGGDGADLLQYSLDASGRIDFEAGRAVVDDDPEQVLSIAGIESLIVVGTDENDWIDTARSGIARQTVYGKGGDDFLAASGFIDGGAGNDFVSGADSNDTLAGGDGNDTLRSGLGNDSVVGGFGNDTLQEAGCHNFVLKPTLATGQGRDILKSIESAILFGTEGSDVIDTTAFRNGVQIFGGAGNDTITTSSGNDTVDGESGDDVVRANGGDDSIYGSLGNDSLFGGDGNDTVAGGAGRDTVIPGNGDDFVSGDAGIDVLRVNAALNLTVHYSEVEGEGLDHFFLNDINTVVDFSNFFFERITITGSAAANVIDTTEYPQRVTVNGGAGNDTIRTGAAADVINGGDGDDSLDSGLGGDVVNGDAGIDSISASGDRNFALTDASFIGFDTDTLTSIDRVAVEGGASANVLDASGFSGSVTLNGNGGNDSLIGGNGNDILSGGDGDDVIKGRNGNDSLDGGAGHDTLNGGAGNDTLSGGDGNDALSGYTGNDFLYGNDGNDTLIGGTGDDGLQGNSGDDLLRGDAGSDSIAGNAGNDSAIILGTSTGDYINRTNTERLVGFIFIADWIDQI